MVQMIETLSKVNEIEIQVVKREDDYYVPIRPICDAIGIDFSSQKQRIERDDILSSTVVITTMVANDKKDREMLCLPVKYVFGWLFSIDISRVKEEAKEIVLQYKIECYDILYEHFFAQYAIFDKQIKEAAARKARIKLLEDDLANNPPQDERINELLLLKKEQSKDYRAPFSQIGKRVKEEMQLIIKFQEENKE